MAEFSVKTTQRVDDRSRISSYKSLSLTLTLSPSPAINLCGKVSWAGSEPSRPQNRLSQVEKCAHPPFLAFHHSLGPFKHQAYDFNNPPR